MTYDPTEKQFLGDVKTHELTVHLDQDTHRHIELSSPGTNSYCFHLLTWPGNLCITGDCGTYTFNRVEDMFCFFRPSEYHKKRHPERLLPINPGYWEEKLTSICRQGRCEIYDEKGFNSRVLAHFGQYWEDAVWAENKKGEMDEMWRAIQEDVLPHASDEHEAYSAVNSFCYRDFTFQDFFDGGGTVKYSFHFIWCLYAIVYGIGVYDGYKKDLADAEREALHLLDLFNKRV